MTAVPQVRRVAMLSVHTSPLEQPGTGDAGGLNVYVVEVSKRLAQRGIEVEIFTRMTDGSLPLQSEIAPGVHVRNVIAGPFEGLGKADLPGQLCAFAQGVMRAEAARPEGWYDLVHSHYWLSGQVGWLAADRWRVPLVHTMHTMARVKNSRLADGDAPEPAGREIGEAQVVDAADRLVANTAGEARELVDLYGADPAKVRVVSPGVDLGLFTVGDVAAARAELGLPQDGQVLLFVGRIQPLKAPDVLLRAAADLLARRPELRRRLVVAVVGGPSGSGLGKPRALQELAQQLGIQARYVSCRRSTGPDLLCGTALLTWSRSRLTVSRSVWSPLRHRLAGRRWWAPRWAACPMRSETAACSLTDIARPTGVLDLGACWTTPLAET